MSGQRWQLLNEWARGGSWEAAQGHVQGPGRFLGARTRRWQLGRGRCPTVCQSKAREACMRTTGQDSAFNVFNIL